MRRNIRDVERDICGVLRTRLESVESHELYRFMCSEPVINKHSWLTIRSVTGPGIKHLSNPVQTDFGVHVSLVRHAEVLIRRLVGELCAPMC